MSSTDCWVFIEYLIYVIWFVMITISIFGNILLSKRRNETFIEKRSSFIVFGLNISFIFAMIATLSLQIGFAHFSVIIQITNSIIWLITFWCFIFFITTKNWLIYYKYKWTYYTIENEWQQIINPKASNKHINNNWYIMNNTKYGNKYYIYKLFGSLSFSLFMICTVCMFPVIISFIKTNLHSEITIFAAVAISLFIMSIPLIFYMYIAAKTPLFEDNFAIHWESNIHLKLVIILTIVYISLCLISIIYTPRALLIGAPIVGFIYFAMNFVSTFMILKKNAIYPKCDGAIRNSSSSTDSNNNYTLSTILSDKEAVHLFMIRLSKEFSMECLLFYIECVQFQNYVSYHIDDNDEVLDRINSLELSPRIPLSAIVEKTEKIPAGYKGDKFLFYAKMKAYKLYKKFIAVGSEFEINISSKDRKQVAVKLGDLKKLLSMENELDLNKLIVLFENCKSEMVKLLNFSLTGLKCGCGLSTQIVELRRNSKYQKDFVQIV